MKLGIMQPYFFPYLGYFSLIKGTDQFILFDSVQFIRHGWIERNRVLKPSEGWQYLGVPLEKKGLTTSIMETRIRNDEDWRGKIVRQLEHYKKRSPFYNETISVVNSALDIDTDSIVLLNAHIMRKICGYLGMPLNLGIYSEMKLVIEDVAGPGDWARNISKALGANEYWNPIGGTEIFDRTSFTDAGIALRFLKHNLKPYSQRREIFEPGLSMIDVMMFNSPATISQMLDDYELV